jgi:hypothetical protein
VRRDTASTVRDADALLLATGGPVASPPAGNAVGVAAAANPVASRSARTVDRLADVGTDDRASAVLAAVDGLEPAGFRPDRPTHDTHTT